MITGSRNYQYFLLAFLIIVFAGVVLYQSGFLKRTVPVEAVRVEKEGLVLYVTGKTGRLEKRVMDVRRGLSDGERMNTILGALKSTGSLRGTFTVQDTAVDDNGTMYVNLQEIPFTNPSPSAIDEIRTVYSVVNSLLSNFRTVSRIQFLVQGKAVYTFGGALYAHLPFDFNEGLLED